MFTLYSELSILLSLIYRPYSTLSSIAFYAIVYAICIRFLLHRKRQAYIWHIMSSTVLFLLSTMEVAMVVSLFALEVKSKQFGTISNAFATAYPVLLTVLKCSVFFSW
jgi:hypothetical protein